jgi:zinc protease
MGFPAAPLGTPDYFALEVLQHVLSGMSGRFFAELRGRRSLAYTVMGGAVARPRSGYFFGYLAGEPRKEAEARDVMLREFERLREEAVSEEELARAKRYIAGVTKIRLQTNAQRGADLVRNLHFGLEPEFTARYLRRIEAVSAEDIRRAARSCFDRDRCAVGVLRGADAEASG